MATNGVYAKLKQPGSQFGAVWLNPCKVEGLDSFGRISSNDEIYTKDPETIKILKSKTKSFRVYEVSEEELGKEPEPEGPITTDKLKELIDIKCNQCGKTFSAQNNLVPTCSECIAGNQEPHPGPSESPEDVEDGTDGSANESQAPSDEGIENADADVGNKKKTYGDRKCINAENEEWQGCDQIFIATHPAQNYCPSCREVRRIASEA